jgi:hypothetical protein
MNEFKIGQRVFYRPANSFKIGGRYLVLRLVPPPKGEPHYIIRSEDGSEREYMADASEVRRVPTER